MIFPDYSLAILLIIQLLRTRMFDCKRSRPSSDIIHRTASAAIMEQGIDVINLGIAPTPFAF